MQVNRLIMAPRPSSLSLFLSCVPGISGAPPSRTRPFGVLHRLVNGRNSDRAQVPRPELGRKTRPAIVSTKCRQFNARPGRACLSTDTGPGQTSATIGEKEYHTLANTYLEQLVEKMEAIEEDRPEVDTEFSAGVLTIAIDGIGKYVINKQPPNRQIWLSSPISGPKRYDWNRELGEWVYSRDHSQLSDLLRSEVGVEMTGWEVS